MILAIKAPPPEHNRVNVFLHFMAWLFSAATSVLIELHSKTLHKHFKRTILSPQMVLLVNKFKLTIRCM